MNTIEFLRSKGIQPSQQRIRIWETLASTKAHPSADAVHRVLASEIPTLSRTTVYSTLDLFVQAGIAQGLEITGSEIRYDADVSAHAHFACRACGAVSDLHSVAVPPAPRLSDGTRVERIQLFVTGICGDCMRRAEGAASTATAAASTAAPAPTATALAEPHRELAAGVGAPR